MKVVIRILCILIGLTIAAGAGVDLALRHRDYAAWLERDSAELGQAQRDIRRFERRHASKLYRELPAKVERADGEAAEVAEPVVRRLEAERMVLFESKQRAIERFSYAVGLAIVLFVIARALKKVVEPRW